MIGTPPDMIKKSKEGLIMNECKTEYMIRKDYNKIKRVVGKMRVERKFLSKYLGVGLGTTSKGHEEIKNNK